MRFCRKIFTSKWWLWSRVEARNFIKTNFKTSQLNEIRLSICRLKSDLNYSEKKRHKNAYFMDDALKTRGIKYFNVETWLFATLSKFLATRLLQLSCVTLVYFLSTPSGVSPVVCGAHLGLLAPCATRLFSQWMRHWPLQPQQRRARSWTAVSAIF